MHGLGRGVVERYFLVYFLSLRCCLPFCTYWSVSSMTMHDPLSADLMVRFLLFFRLLSALLSFWFRLHSVVLGFSASILFCIVWKYLS